MKHELPSVVIKRGLLENPLFFMGFSSEPRLMTPEGNMDGQNKGEQMMGTHRKILGRSWAH